MFEKLVYFLKKNSDMFEIYSTKASILNIEVFNEKTDFISESNSFGLGIRVYINGKLGFASTSDQRKIMECAKSAIKLAKVNKKDKDFVSFAKKEKCKNLVKINKNLLEYGPKDFLKFHREFISYVKEVDKKIKISSSAYYKIEENVRVINSEGVDLEETNLKNIFDSEAVLERNGRKEALDVSKGELAPINPKIGLDLGKRLINCFNKNPVVSGEMQLLLHPEAVANFFNECFVFAINSENVQHKKSVYFGKIDERICDKKFNIIDDGMTRGLFCTRSFDCEGIPSKKTLIVKNGVLKNFIYNTYTANKEGKESTSNAYRTVETLPIIDCNNFIIKPGKKRLLDEIDKGLYVRGLIGTHTINTATGDFSLGVLEGYYVEKGEIKFPVKNVMIVGNFFDMIKDVELGKSIEHCFCGTGGFYVPELFVPKIKVVGKA